MAEMRIPDLSDDEKSRPYARYYYREPARVADDVLSAIESGPIDPADALPFERKNGLLDPGYHAKETGYCFLPDGSCYVAVLTRMPGVTGEMLDWWFSWHALENLRYKIWYPGSHTGIGVKERARLEDASIPFRERYWNTTHYPAEDIGIGTDVLSITFVPPMEFGFDTARFKEARVATAICTRVGSVTKRAEHTDMCHLVREAGAGVEMRSRFLIGRKMKVKMFSEQSPVNRIVNTKFMRKIFIPPETPQEMARHCAQEYSNLAEILPELFNDYS
ncbi:MAG: hydrolase [Spirochaetes bacterium]|nr:hydrolase [Spirochaetota bacterium]